jgi:hypothetical protein
MTTLAYSTNEESLVTDLNSGVVYFNQLDQVTQTVMIDKPTDAVLVTKKTTEPPKANWWWLVAASVAIYTVS